MDLQSSNGSAWKNSDKLSYNTIATWPSDIHTKQKQYYVELCHHSKIACGLTTVRTVQAVRLQTKKIKKRFSETPKHCRFTFFPKEVKDSWGKMDPSQSPQMDELTGKSRRSYRQIIKNRRFVRWAIASNWFVLPWIKKTFQFSIA